MTRGVLLDVGEREEISRGVATGDSGRVIALRLGRHYSVVNREIARNGGRLAYRAAEAGRNATVAACRPKARKIERDALLLAEVNRGFRQGWSPQQIAARLRADFPDNEAMRVSHEALYRSLFVQAKGGLKAELVGRLRSGRTRRVGREERRAIIVRKQAIPDMAMITERPAEVEDRAVPGHWEGDMVRHEALCFRAEVKDLRRCVVAAA
jgi:IS30 family transposase